MVTAGGGDRRIGFVLGVATDPKARQEFAGIAKMGKDAQGALDAAVASAVRLAPALAKSAGEAERLAAQLERAAAANERLIAGAARAPRPIVPPMAGPTSRPDVTGQRDTTETKRRAPARVEIDHEREQQREQREQQRQREREESERRRQEQRQQQQEHRETTAAERGAGRFGGQAMRESERAADAAKRAAEAAAKGQADAAQRASDAATKSYQRAAAAARESFKQAERAQTESAFRAAEAAKRAADLAAVAQRQAAQSVSDAHTQALEKSLRKADQVRAADERKQEKSAQRAAAKLEQEFERAQAKIDAGNSQIREGFERTTEGVLKLGRGFVALGLVGEEDTRKILDVLLKVQGTIDLVRGGIDLYRGLASMVRGYRTAVIAATAAEEALAAARAVSAAAGGGGFGGRLGGVGRAAAGRGMAGVAGRTLGIAGAAAPMLIGGGASVGIGGGATAAGAAGAAAPWIAAAAGLTAAITSLALTIREAQAVGFGQGARAGSLVDRVATAEVGATERLAGFLRNNPTLTKGLDIAGGVSTFPLRMGITGIAQLAGASDETIAAINKAIPLRPASEFAEEMNFGTEAAQKREEELRRRREQQERMSRENLERERQFREIRDLDRTVGQQRVRREIGRREDLDPLGKRSALAQNELADLLREREVQRARMEDIQSRRSQAERTGDSSMAPTAEEVNSALRDSIANLQEIAQKHQEIEDLERERQRMVVEGLRQQLGLAQQFSESVGGRLLDAQRNLESDKERLAQLDPFERQRLQRVKAKLDTGQKLTREEQELGSQFSEFGEKIAAQRRAEADAMGAAGLFAGGQTRVEDLEEQLANAQAIEAGLETKVNAKLDTETKVKVDLSIEDDGIKEAIREGFEPVMNELEKLVQSYQDKLREEMRRMLAESNQRRQAMLGGR